VRLPLLARATLLLTLLACVSCSGGALAPARRELPPLASAASLPGRFIKHVVVIVQENRSFDNLFAGFPGADTATSGLTHSGARISLHPITFSEVTLGHVYQTAMIEYDKGKMDGFDLVRASSVVRQKPGTIPYAYVERSLVQPYWTMAEQYALADHFFATEWGASFTAHQDLIAGTTALTKTESLVNVPSAYPWGCDAPVRPPTVTYVLTVRRAIKPGPRPCLTQYPTIAQSLDAEHVSWRYYAPYVTGPNANLGGELFSAFDAIKAVRYGPDWKNVVSPQTQVLADAEGGNLASVSWVVPDFLDSDHPSAGSDTGPSWVASVVNAIGQGPDWKSTAIVIVWDDWGGWYDHVKPPQLDYVGLGFRLPCIIVSPYIKPATISSTQYEYGSILKFIEQVFRLPSLGTTDVRANSLLNVFDFRMKPRAFTAIAAKYPASYFLRRPPSLKPVDDE
jgi:phospholipase C